MKKKTAVFVDWENVRKELEYIQKNSKLKTSFNYNDVDFLIKLFTSFIDDVEEEIYRIFFYTAIPFKSDEISQVINNKYRKDTCLLKNFNNYFTEEKKEKMNQTYRLSKSLIDKLSVKDYFAIRKGELKIHGIDLSGRPNIVQKQVDMLIGLDIAHVSYERIVDRIVVFCKDTDIKPALKVARINAVQTILPNLKEGYKIENVLKIHNDLIREKSIVDILN